MLGCSQMKKKSYSFFSKEASISIASFWRYGRLKIVKDFHFNKYERAIKIMEGNFGLVTFRRFYFCQQLIRVKFFASKWGCSVSSEPVILFCHQNSYVDRYWLNFLEMVWNSLPRPLCLHVCVRFASFIISV